MFLESFKISGFAVAQIFILGAIGFFLVKKNVLGDEGLDALSRLTIDIVFPILIFCQLIKDFSFELYPNWWIFPLISIAITILGLAVGFAFSLFLKGREHRIQFVNLVGFQNSGYLPLTLIAALSLSSVSRDTIFIYLFLFLLGFNLVMFSLGVYLLTFSKGKKFELKNLFNPPVVAVLASLILIFFRLNSIPGFIYKPLNMIGNSALPLAMFVVGGNLAQIRLRNIDKHAVFLLILTKLIILPLIGLLVILKINMPQLIALLIIIQLSAPSATTLSVITRHYKREDLLISQGIFFSHLVSILTIPVFLSLFFSWSMIK